MNNALEEKEVIKKIGRIQVHLQRAMALLEDITYPNTFTNGTHYEPEHGWIHLHNAIESIHVNFMDEDEQSEEEQEATETAEADKRFGVK